MKIEITKGVETPVTKFFSTTPETDVAEYYIQGEGNYVRSDISRKLERERGEANTKLQDVSSKLADALRERDEARAHWGTESMNAAQFFGEKTKAIAERDEAREERDWAIKQVSTLQSTFEDWQLKMLSEQAEALQKIDSEYDKLFDEAHQIRIERDEAREVASGLSIQEERVNEAQKELSSIHRWIDKNHADGFIDSLTYLQNLERVADNWYDRIDAIETDARRFVRERDEARHKLELCMAANSDVARIAKERDEAREALREAWLAMDEVDGTDRMVNWQNKNASILEGAK